MKVANWERLWRHIVFLTEACQQTLCVHILRPRKSRVLTWGGGGPATQRRNSELALEEDGSSTVSLPSLLILFPLLT